MVKHRNQQINKISYFLFHYILIYLVYLPPKDRISVGYFRRYSGFCKNVTSMLAW